MSWTLSLYIGRQYLIAFLCLFGAFLLVILLADTLELMRQVSGRPDVTFQMVLRMALLKLPFMGQKTFPFVALFAGMAVFWRMSRSNEMDVIRAAGISAWQFLLPAIVVALGLGVFLITVLNPVASAFLARYERESAVLVERKISTLALRKTGLWLREGSEEGQTVIHAIDVVQSDDGVELRDVSVFRYQGTDEFVERIDAAKGLLEPGSWRLEDVWILLPEQRPESVPLYELPTDLTLARIENSFAPPETISFWELPGFIGTLEAAGFSAIGHRLQLHVLLAAPLLMCGMVFVASTFSLRHSRRGGAILVIGAGLATAFALHIFSDVVLALGLADRLPTILAAWTPSLIVTLVGLTSLLFLEDG